MKNRLRSLTMMTQTAEEPPRDLDSEVPGFMENFAQQIAAPPVVSQFAPKQLRIQEAIMQGNDELKEKISSTLGDVQKVVKDEIASMRRELDDLEKVIDESCDSARRTMQNALNIAAHSLAAASDIRSKIHGFRQIVENTIPAEGTTGGCKS